MGDNNTVSMTINGRKYVFAIGHEFGQIPTSETLCQTLRNRLDLTGTKESCSEGACGCCTVIMNGHAVASCITLTVDCDGAEITTLEGLADPETGELLAKSVTDYSKDESGEASVLGTTLYDRSYGGSYLPDRELAAEAFNSDEVCTLTLVYNPGAADEETQEISIKRGTYVTFVSSTGNQLYADAELTKTLDDTAPIDTNGASTTVYVVPDAPMN